MRFQFLLKSTKFISRHFCTEPFERMPLDIRMFRKDQGGDPDLIKKSETKRFHKNGPELVDQIIDMDNRWRKCMNSKKYLLRKF